MELFICSSNYQLLNTIMIVHTYKVKADLIILRKSVYKNCDIDFLQNTGLFREIYCWSELLEKLTDEKIRKPSDKVIIQLYKLFSYLNKNRIWNSLPNKNETYKKIHISYIDSITLWIYAYFKQFGAELSLYEDGTYSYGCLAIRDSCLRRAAKKILYKTDGISECTQMYIKHPERVLLGSKEGIKLLKIESHPKTEFLENTILGIYRSSVHDVKKFETEVIIFDQNIELSEVKNIQREIATGVSGIVGKDNVLIKLHPSSRDTCYGNITNTFAGQLPFEVLMAYTNVDDKILISIFSTACMSPKLDYDQEPIVIFTYKLYGDKFQINEEYLKQIEKLRDNYTKKERVIVPESMDELYTVLVQAKKREE